MAADSSPRKLGQTRHLRTLLWKNAALKRRAVGATIAELLVPLFFTMVLFVLRQAISKDVDPSEPAEYFALLGDDAVPEFTVDSRPYLLYYPNTSSDVVDVVNIMESILTPWNLSGVVGYSSRSEMELASRSDFIDVGSFPMGVDFEAFNTTTKEIRYSVRLEDFLTPTKERLLPERLNRGSNKNARYLLFSRIQSVVDRAVAIFLSGDSNALDGVELWTANFPYPPTDTDDFSDSIRFSMPFVMVLSFIYTVSVNTKGIVFEKETQLRSMLKLFGVSNTTWWMGWLISDLAILSIVVTVMAVLLSAGDVIVMTDFSVIWVALLLNGLAIVAVSFLFGAILRRSKTAGAFASVVYFLMYIPYTFFAPEREFFDSSRSLKQLLCIFSPSAFGFASFIMSEFELRSTQLTWDTLNTLPDAKESDQLTMADVMSMLLIDAILYTLLAIYIDQISPGDYGVPRGKLYFLRPSYWCGKKAVERSDGREMVHVGGAGDATGVVEPMSPDSNLRPGISIHNLTKRFGRTTALNGLSLTMYEGQITSFLGHNGAGKSTTISILTGMYAPTEGDAYVDGESIRTSFDELRMRIGLCPQQDVYYEELTIAEHMAFFGQLKGLSPETIKSETDTFIQTFSLSEKRFAKAKTLSGGTKRKLCVGLAFLGGSKFVFLDEPTAGMDPEARRACWDFIRQRREGRTIVLTTHFLDEADVLGDRVAIISNGKLQCCGTSLFLKNRFGEGYQLTILKEGVGGQHSSNTDAIVSLVHRYVPNAILDSDAAGELLLILPMNAADSFEQLFRALEAQKAELHIDSYGVSGTSLEQVFLKMAAVAMNESHGDAAPAGNPLHSGDAKPQQSFTNGTKPEAKPIEDANDAHVDIPRHSSAAHFSRPLHTKSGRSLWLTQVAATMRKRLRHSLRDRRAVISQLITPVFFVVIALAVSEVSNEGDAIPITIDLDLDLYAEFSTQTVPFFEDAGGIFSGSLYTLMGKTVDQLEDLAGDFSIPLVNRTADGDQSDFLEYMSQTFLTNASTDRFGAFEFDRVSASVLNVTAFYNSDPFHSMPIYVNLLGNALVNAVNDETYRIRVENVPWPLSAAQRVDDIDGGGTGLTIAIMIIFGMSFLAASFVIFLVVERVAEAKHLQFVSGLRVSAFWIGTFLWDFINYTVPFVLILLVIGGWGSESFTKDGQFGGTLALLLAFGWSVLPMVYILSFWFRSGTSAYVASLTIVLFGGLATAITTQVLDSLNEAESVNDALKWLFLVLPQYCIGRGFMDLDINYRISSLVSEFDGSIDTDILERFGIEIYDSPFDMEYVGRNVLVMAIMGPVYMAVVMYMENRRVRAGQDHSKSSAKIVSEYTSRKERKTGGDGDRSQEDVHREKARISTALSSTISSTNSDEIIVHDLHKVFLPRKADPVHAVRGVSFGVPKGECFGLLGTNGAGKSTVFKMLTGEEKLSAGQVYMHGFSTSSDMNSARRFIGYCPQVHALLPTLTARETLRLFAEVRGVAAEDVPKEIERAMELLEMTRYADTLSGGLSGGNKRKLSVAIALMGRPPILLLDEPTTGMDAKAKRFLWDTIDSLVQVGQSVVLTTHSMEECEALCKRLAIMVRGRFRCIGSLQRLKDSHGQSYTVVAKAHRSSLEGLLANLNDQFPGTVLREEHAGTGYYAVPISAQWSLADLFGFMEQLKVAGTIDEYGVTQTSLEQIFISFARGAGPVELQE